jgi:hypothetical protein
MDVSPDSNAAALSVPHRRSTAARHAQAAVHVAAAALLMAAALLKAYQAVAGPAEVRSTASRLLELGLIEFELIVAAMLLLNVLPFAARYLALTAFTVFAGVSLRKAMSGFSTCGCFGPVDVDPRATAAIDLLMVLLLALAPSPSPPPSSPTRWSVWRRIALMAFTVLMIAAAGAVAFAALPKRGLMVAGSAVHDFGLVAPDRAARCEHTFLIRNTASRPIRITGFHSSCGCAVAYLPASPIPPGDSAEVRVRADWTGVVGQPYARVTLSTDNFWTRKVLLTIHAEIPPAPAPGKPR